MPTASAACTGTACTGWGVGRGSRTGRGRGRGMDKDMSMGMGAGMGAGMGRGTGREGWRATGRCRGRSRCCSSMGGGGWLCDEERWGMQCDYDYDMLITDCSFCMIHDILFFCFLFSAFCFLFSVFCFMLSVFCLLFFVFVFPFVVLGYIETQDGKFKHRCKNRTRLTV